MITQEYSDLSVLYRLLACAEPTGTSLVGRTNDDGEGGLLREPPLKQRFDELPEAGLDVLLGEGVGHGDGEDRVLEPNGGYPVEPDAQGTHVDVAFGVPEHLFPQLLGR